MKNFKRKIPLLMILQITKALEISDSKNPSGTISLSSDSSFQFSSVSGASSLELVTSFPKGCGRKGLDFLLLKVKENVHQSKSGNFAQERVYKGCSGDDFPSSIRLPAEVLISSSNWTTNSAMISYFFSSRDPPAPRLIGCDVSFSSISSSQKADKAEKMTVLCPAGCAKTSGGVFGEAKVGFDPKSSICRAGIHAAEISDSFGGALELTHVVTPDDLLPGSIANSIRSLQSISKTNFIPIGFSKEPSKCGNENILEVDLDKVKTSSFLKAYLDSSDPEMTPVETVLNWKGENAFSGGAFPWAPAIDDKNPWIQVDFNGGLMRLERIETKGSELNPFPWSASKFKIQIYKEGEWNSLQEQFSADIASSSHTFMTPLLAEKIRIYPEAAADSPVPAMNILFYGCEAPLPPKDNSPILIAVIIALAGVALILAMVSLLLIKRTKSKEAKFSKTVFRAPNIYTQNPMETLQNMKYVSYAQPQNGHQPVQNHPGRMFNPPYSNESQYNIPFIHHARKMTTLPPAPAPYAHEYSDLETLPIKKNVMQDNCFKDSSYDDHTYSTLG